MNERKKHMTSKFKRFVAVFVVLALLLTAIPLSISSANGQSPLKDKNILFVGDSIAAGWRDVEYGGNYTNNGGWAARIDEDCGANSTLAATADVLFPPSAPPRTESLS